MTATAWLLLKRIATRGTSRRSCRSCRSRRGHPSPPSRRRGAEGFSLLETVIAMAVLGIGLLAVAQMIPVALAGVTQAGVRTNAVQAAQQRLDDVRSTAFADLEPGSYTEAQGKYTLAWTVTDEDPVPGNKRIVMTASWETARGARSTTLNTYVARGNSTD